jgi:hypothetical protein
MKLFFRFPGLSLAFATLATIAVLQAAPPVVFHLPPNFPAGDGPAQIGSADFNGDSIPDLATANFDDGTVSVLLGTGGGSFAAACHYPAGAGADSLAVGDLNGDHKLDIVAANANGWNQAGTLSILVGRGDGTFEPAASVTVGRGPRGVVLADFNNDGKLDLATAISGGWFETNQVNVLLGRGDCTFNPPTAFTVGTSPEWIAAGDFNGDQHPDLAVVNAGPGPSGTTVGVLLNQGDGTFASAATYTVGTYPGFIAAADLNKDGLADLVVANRASSSVSVLLAKADGTFNPTVNRIIPEGVGQIAVHDFDKDGSLDLAVLGGDYDAGVVSVLLGNGFGSFGAPVSYNIGVGLNAIASADLSGDGSADVVVAGGYDSALLLMQGNGDGTFKDVTDTYPVPGSIDGIIEGDFNGDNQLDIATADYGEDAVSVLLQQTNGVFLPAVSYATGSQPRAVKSGDFNNDGRLDLVVANFDGTVTMLRGRTTAPGVFTNDWGNGFLGTVQIGSNHTDVAVGSFNGGTHLDIVTPNYYGASLSVALGDGTGNFHEPFPPVVSVNSGPTSVVVEDFNGDGKADVAVGYEGGYKLSIATGRGDGSFDPKVDIDTWEIPWFIAAADVNFDGKPDLVAAHYDWRRVSVMLNRTTPGSTLQFDPPLMHDVANDPVSVAVGDFNGDNLPDIVSGNYASVSVLLGNGDGTFLSATNYFVGGRYAAVGDFNKDGMHDIAIDLGRKVGLFWNDTLPRLQIGRAEGGVRVAWPAWKYYALEAGSSAAGPWMTIDTTPATFGNQYVITNSAEGANQVFRLKRVGR